MFRIALFLFIFSAAPVLFGQSNLTPEQVTEYSQIKDDIAGTYQVQMIDTRSLPSIELSVFKQIQDARLQSETTYIDINSNCRVMILSQDEINASGFVPLEYLSYINTSDL